MSEFTPEMRAQVEAGMDERRWLSRKAVRALLAAYDALHAQPSAEPTAEFRDAAAKLGLTHLRMCEPTTNPATSSSRISSSPAPPREAGLPLDLSHIPADMAEAVEMLARARDRLATIDGVRSALQRAQVELNARDRSIAALQSELAQATARAEQAQSALRDLITDVENGWGDPHTLRHARAALASGTGAK